MSRSCAGYSPVHTRGLLCFGEHTWVSRRNQDDAQRGSGAAPRREDDLADDPVRRMESVSEGLLEVPSDEGVKALAKPAVASQEEPAFRGKPRAAVGPASGSPLEKLHASRALQLAKVPPGRPVRHAHALDCLLERAEPVHRFEEVSAPLTELDVVPEDHPELESWPALDRSPHRATSSGRGPRERRDSAGRPRRRDR